MPRQKRYFLTFPMNRKNNNKDEGIPFLKLVTKDGDYIYTRHSAYVEPEQLLLPNIDGNQIFFCNTKKIEGDKLYRMVEQLKPKFIIDARFTPSLAHTFGSRHKAFRMFESHQIIYIDLFGRTRISNILDFEKGEGDFRNAFIEFLDGQTRRGPYLFLVDREATYSAAKALIPKVLEDVLHSKLAVLSLAE